LIRVKYFESLKWSSEAYIIDIVLKLFKDFIFSSTLLQTTKSFYKYFRRSANGNFWPI